MSKRMKDQTRRWIFDSLIDLMSQKDFTDISITEIMANADLSRRTFYRFYKSKDELIRGYSEAIFADYLTYIGKQKFSAYDETFLTIFFTYWSQYKEPFHQFQQQGLFGIILTVYNEKIVEVYEHIDFPWHDASLSKSEVNIVMRFFLGGLWNVVADWQGNNQELSPAELAQTVLKGLKMVTK